MVTELPNDWCVKSLIASNPALPFQSSPLPLQSLYVLGDGRNEQVVFERLKSASALTELFKYAFILDIDDRSRLRAHFDRLAQLAGTIECYMLDYPRQYEALPEVIAAVLAHAQSGVRNP